MKRYLVCAFLTACLGLPLYGQQATSAKCKAASTGCTMRPRFGSTRTVVADAGFGTFVMPRGWNPQRARLERAALTTQAETAQASGAAAPVIVQEDSLGEIARRFRAEKKTRHVPVLEDEE